MLNTNNTTVTAKERQTVDKLVELADQINQLTADMNEHKDSYQRSGRALINVINEMNSYVDDVDLVAGYTAHEYERLQSIVSGNDKVSNDPEEAVYIINLLVDGIMDEFDKSRWNDICDRLYGEN